MHALLWRIISSREIILSGKKKEEPAKPATKICPYCRSEIAAEATRCPHCTSELAK